MNFKKKSVCMGALVTLLLTGCAADPRLGPGGKSGYVTEFYSPDQLRKTRPACLANLTASEIDSNVYAEIQVQNGRGRRYISALVPQSLKPALHDKVEVAPSKCEVGQIPTVRQILSAKSK
nr:hypothetical protein [uncultured Duganella sp.]